MSNTENFDKFGASQFVGPQVTGVLPVTTGRYIYVHASGSATSVGLIPKVPVVTTIDAAINKTRAGKHDVVVVMPGHTETITGAAGIALDVASTTVVGLGSGNNRPVVTISSTDNSGTITQSGDNTSLLNLVVVTNDDGLTNAVVVSGDNCVTDIEHQDASVLIEAATVVRGDTANNWKLRLKHLGFTGGNAGVSAVRLDDCDNVDIEIDAYGVVTTAWVEMVDVASTNVSVRGRMYTQGVTNFTRDVVDTITGSTWDAVIFDSSAGAQVSGGSAAALAVDDVTAIASDVTTIKGNVGGVDSATNVLGADDADNQFASTNVVPNDDGSVLERLEGLKNANILARGTFTTSSATVPADTSRTEANDYWNGCYLVPTAGSIAFEPRLIVDFANTGGVFTLDTDIPFTAVPGLVAYAIIPGNVQIAPTADSTATQTPAHVIGRKTDASVTTVGTTASLAAYAKGILTDNLALPRAVEKSDGAVLSGSDDLFTITGGPIKILEITGIVTTQIGAGTTNVKLQITTTDPAATVDMNAAAVDIDADAVGTSYQTINTTGIFTPVTAGYVKEANSFATLPTTFLAPIGTIKLNSDAARSGNIKWYLRYVPLSQNSRVAAAA